MLTDQQKEQINSLRLQGTTYPEIAKQLSLTESCVKTFCYRNRINLVRCPQCGKIVLQTEHRKPKRFCSTKCRMTWWNHNADQGKRTPHHTQVCPVCNQTFDCYHSKQRVYCSRKCYVEARNSGKEGHNG